MHLWFQRGTSRWWHYDGQGNRTPVMPGRNARRPLASKPWDNQRYNILYRIKCRLPSQVLWSRHLSTVWNDVLEEIYAIQEMEGLPQFYEKLSLSKITVKKMHLQSMSSRIILARLFPCVCRRYFSTQSTKWSLYAPLDELMENVRRQQLMNISVGEIIRKWLHSWVNLSTNETKRTTYHKLANYTIFRMQGSRVALFN